MNPTTMRQISLINTPLNVPPMRDITDDLPKHPDHTWETFPTRYDEDGNEVAGLRDYEEIFEVAIHHSGVLNGSPQSHANYKIRQGLPGNPYHIQIVRGQPLQTNDLLAFTYGVGNFNHHTIHVSVEGDFTRQTLTQEDRDALYAVIVTLDELFQIVAIRGHNEYPGGKTGCPGFNMHRVREDVHSLKERMDYDESEHSERSRAYNIAERILDLYNKAKGGPYEKEAVRKLLETEHQFKQNKWL